MPHLDLSDDEGATLIKKLHATVENDRYPLCSLLGPGCALLPILPTGYARKARAFAQERAVAIEAPVRGDDHAFCATLRNLHIRHKKDACR